MLALRSWTRFTSLKRGGLKSLRTLTTFTKNENIDKEAILDSSLSFVFRYGWSQKAIENGAKELNLPGIVHGIFPRGGADLIDHFEMKCNSELVKYLEELNTREDDPVKGGRLVQSAVEKRLRMLIPYIEHWPEAMFIKAYPSNVITSLDISSKMFDDIWYIAGDRSTDINWYTKRGLLAAVYCSTELYMVQDNSVDFQDTWSFLRRRFQDTRTITETRQQFDSLVDFACDFSTGAFTTVRNMVGLGSRNR